MGGGGLDSAERPRECDSRLLPDQEEQREGGSEGRSSGRDRQAEHFAASAKLGVSFLAFTLVPSFRLGHGGNAVGEAAVGRERRRRRIVEARGGPVPETPLRARRCDSLRSIFSRLPCGRLATSYDAQFSVLR